MLGVTAEQMLLGAVVQPTTRRPAEGRCLRTGAYASSTSYPDRRQRARSFCKRWAARKPLIFRRTPAMKPYAGMRGKAPPARVSSGIDQCGVPGNGRIIFLIEDNGYAISGAGGTANSRWKHRSVLSGFPELKRIEVDGTDFLVLYHAMSEAVAYARARRGPALFTPPSRGRIPIRFPTTSGYIRPERSAMPRGRAIPFLKFPEWLVSEGLHRQSLQVMLHEVDQEIQQATDRAARRTARERVGAAASFFRDNRSDFSRIRCGAAIQRRSTHHGGRDQPDPGTRRCGTIRAMLVFGEDVADCSREASLKEVKGKGGVFKATAGLQIEFGSARSFNTPLAEAAIIGRAIGLATRGMKPVPEIQFFDYIWPAMMQIRDELATLRWRSNNDVQRADGDACRHRRIPERRRHLSQPMRRGRYSLHIPACG